MKKGILFLTILALLTVGTLYYFRNYIGDPRAALFPSKNDLAEIIEKQTTDPQKTGEETDFPLTLPEGFQIGVFAKDLNAPRDMVFTEAGTLLVSIPGQGKVVALPDKDGDGKADRAVDILNGFGRPHGLAFHNSKLFVAEERQVSRFNWNEEKLLAVKEKDLIKLPTGGRHTSRTIAFDNKNNMYISLGSTCDTCYEDHPWIGTVIISDEDGNDPRVYSKGLRNAVFINSDPSGEKIWGTEMGRDNLGDNIPPDEINILQDNGDFGWPLCYGDKVHDTVFDKNTYIRDPCEDTIPPVFNIQAHSAPLGLVFINSPQFPDSWQGDLLVAYHGSWNRTIPTGYKIVRLDVEGEKINSQEDFLTGFLQGSTSLGRPVDVIFDQAGSLYISDDKAGNIYKIVAQQE